MHKSKHRKNIKELFEGYPIVCEAFDRPDQKAMLVRELLSQFSETIVVSGNGMAGFGDTNNIQTKQMMKRLYVLWGPENRCRKWDRSYGTQSGSLCGPPGQ